MQNLIGKIAIVTGAARGIGAACAKALAEQGAAVVLTDVLSDAGETFAQSLRDTGFKAIFKHHDVTDKQSWQQLVDSTVTEFGRLDILVNNAGINLITTIEELSVEQFRKVLDVNLLGVFLGTQTAIGQMKASGGGAIVNIASNSTRAVIPLTVAYSPSKAAVANLTKVAAVHCAQAGYNIRVNSVHPGPVQTDMLTGDAKVPLDIFAQLIPLKRIGQPREIGEVVAFLAGDGASFVTGAEIFVDGGMTISMT